MLKTIHHFTGLMIAIYIGFHMLNHLLILHSEQLHLKFMKTIRKVYRHPAIEPILLAGFVVQIISGVLLAILKWSPENTMFEKIQIFSGLYLALFLINHIRAVIIGRRRMKIDTNLYYGAGVMNMWPQKLFFIPYYFLAILAFFAHVAAIHRSKMIAFVSEQSANLQANLILIFGVLIAVIIIYKMSHLKKPIQLTSINREA